MGISLVLLQPSSSKNHFVPVWLSDMGCPLLGDQMYDYRARTLMGHKVKVGIKNTQANRQQKLPSAVMDRLGVRKGEEWRVPKHLHQFRINLPDFLGPGKHLTVFAPPPKYFSLTSAKLGIDIKFREVAERDEVAEWEARGDKKKKKELVGLTDLEQNINELRIVD